MIQEPKEAPRVKPGGLVTVAYLKARLDEGVDHLGLFMPLLVDVLAAQSAQSFATADIQERLATIHGIAMPQQTVTTLLKRAVTKKLLVRDVGRYRRNPSHPLPVSNLPSAKLEIEAAQSRLSEALRAHAARRELLLPSSNAALDLLVSFLEEEQIALLLGTPSTTLDSKEIGRRKRAIVAEFLTDVVRNDPGLLAVLRGMLEGLVLYHAAFLPDLSSATRHFNKLRVAFDSNLVRQALGYEGIASTALLRDTIDILKADGAQCIVFDKTMLEIKRILSMYETRLATAEGRRSLRPVPMARHFLIERYSPSAVREMSALLEGDIASIGLTIVPVPVRVRQHTAEERTLAQRLVDPQTKDELEPRVVHDVDCVAAILTIRKGRRAVRIEDAVAVFVTSSPLVIRNTRLWWEEDEHESGMPPVVHVRALATLAWLKKPSLSSDLKVHELVALCTAALRPSQETWQRFLRHLDLLQTSKRLNSDEAAAVMVSAMSDQLLFEAEVTHDDPQDIDAVTLDEIVDRVRHTYSAQAEERIQRVSVGYQTKLTNLEARERDAIARADAAQNAMAEDQRQRELAIERHARRKAHWITTGAHLAVTGLVVAGAVALILGHPLHSGALGLIIGLSIILFILLELIGILRHVSRWRAEAEARLTSRFRRQLRATIGVHDTRQIAEMSRHDDVST